MQEQKKKDLEEMNRVFKELGIETPVTGNDKAQDNTTGFHPCTKSHAAIYSEIIP